MWLFAMVWGQLWGSFQSSWYRHPTRTFSSPQIPGKTRPTVRRERFHHKATCPAIWSQPQPLAGSLRALGHLGEWCSESLMSFTGHSPVWLGENQQLSVKQAPITAPLPHLLLRMETDSKGLSHREPEFHPLLSWGQDELALKSNDLLLKAKYIPLIPSPNEDKWFLNFVNCPLTYLEWQIYERISWLYSNL